MRLSKLVRAAQRLDRVFNQATYICLLFSGALLTLMAWSTSYGALRRYLFRNPEPYTYELASIILLVATMLSVAHTQRLRRNIAIDLVLPYISEKARHIIDIIGSFLGIIFCVVFFWTGLQFAQFGLKSGQTTLSGWTIPLFPLEIVIPIGVFLLCLVLISQFIQRLYLLVRKTN
jgi:TRAP-type C4-dicarboxylate transport system permease small subunit